MHSQLTHPFSLGTNRSSSCSFSHLSRTPSCVRQCQAIFLDSLKNYYSTHLSLGLALSFLALLPIYLMKHTCHLRKFSPLGDVSFGEQFSILQLRASCRWMYKAARSSQEVSVKNEFTAAAAVLRKYHSSDDKQICNAPIQHSLLSSYLV